ncbi:hypothetical protein S40293_08510 [Stachybotrys chartarum IBT 40293]|nr:hypothetical protein S40293_08510 [Stachybotrys chartarum IBT 40293]
MDRDAERDRPRPSSSYSLASAIYRYTVDGPPPPVPRKDDKPYPGSPPPPTLPPVELPRPYTAVSDASERTLKFGTGKHAQVELIPQPSDSPDDPLNWPQWRKELNFVTLLLLAGLIAGMKTAFMSTNAMMAAQFRVPYSSVVALTAVPLVLSAFSGLASLVVSKMFGKRPVYLVSFVFLFIGTIWNMTTGTSFGGSMGARVFQGLGWGAFDTLVLGSIQDTYFEHERSARVTAYNIFVVVVTWGSPFLGGAASETAGSFTVQFQIINAFYIAAIPLLALGAPETSFDRASAAVLSGALPTPSITPTKKAALLSKEGVVAYLKKMSPLAYRGEMTLATVLQAPRAFVTPTTGLIFLVTVIPYAGLWSFSESMALLFARRPENLLPEGVGALLLGPWFLSIAVVSSFGIYRRVSDKLKPRALLLNNAIATSLITIGILALGLYVEDVLGQLRGVVNPLAGRDLSLPLVSFLVGLLAAGLYTLDATTHPLIAESTAFTCSNITVARRATVDMHAGVVFWRNLATGIFVATIPNGLVTFSGLKATAIGLGVTHMLLAAAVGAAWWFFDGRIRRGDGVLMSLVDLSLLKRSVVSISPTSEKAGSDYR